MPLTFHSIRLTFRALRTADLDELYDIFNDPETQHGYRGLTFSPQPESWKESYKKRVETHPLQVVAVDTQSNELIGTASIRFGVAPELRGGLLAVVLKKCMWGKGYGTELVGWVVQHAFKFLGLHRVSLEVFSYNVGAIALYKKMYVRFCALDCEFY
jgi:RimJ/RimL family protein N-acetyltransferase